MLSMLIFAAASAAQPRIVVPSTGGPAAGFSRCHDRGVETVDAKQKTPVRAQNLNARLRSARGRKDQHAQHGISP